MAEGYVIFDVAIGDEKYNWKGKYFVGTSTGNYGVSCADYSFENAFYNMFHILICRDSGNSYRTYSIPRRRGPREETQGDKNHVGKTKSNDEF